jgi:hypothetical protein
MVVDQGNAAVTFLPMGADMDSLVRACARMTCLGVARPTRRNPASYWLRTF